MNCQDVLERLGEYRDLSPDDPVKADIDRHVCDCASCREEFLFWQQSAKLILTVAEPADMRLRTGSVADKVMARIYETESWRKPVVLHTYSLSWRVRRNVMACFAMCLAFFFAAFMLSLVPDADEVAVSPEFNIQVVTVVAQGESPEVQPSIFSDTPVVSVGPTVLLMAGSAQTTANVYMAASISGLIITLLLMNWLSRLRA
jgi:hypothetical protein